MARPLAAIVIPSFNGAWRVRHLLQSILRNDPVARNVPILVVEDKCEVPGVAEKYDALKEEFHVPLIHLPEWSNMHGAAQAAFEHAIELYNPEWIIYLGDDCVATRGAISNMLYFLVGNVLDSVGAVQFPYFNAHDLSAEAYGEWRMDVPLWPTKDGYWEGLDWTDKVPRNPHWDGDGRARPYINVNGVGFAAHAATFREVGGFAAGTWCLDESLSVRIWLESHRGIICIPGPPLVHFFGASTLAMPPAHDLHTEERWTEAMGVNKAEAGRLCAIALEAMTPRIMRDLSCGSYWSDKGA